jgi:hypothetical protein
MVIREGSDCQKCLYRKHPDIGVCPIYDLANANEVTLTITGCDNLKPFSQSRTMFSLRDLERAEYRCRGTVGHEDVVARLEWLRARPINDQKVGREELGDTEREMIEDYCRIEGETILVP